MPEYKSRINIRVSVDQQDWEKLADIKTKEEWKLDESVEEIFRIADYLGGFIKTDDWSVDPETLEDLVKTFTEIAGYEKCVIIADVVEQNVENPSGTSFLALGNQNFISISYLNSDKLNETNISYVCEYLKQIDFDLGPDDIYYLRQHFDEFSYDDTKGIDVVILERRNMIIRGELSGDIVVKNVVIPYSVKSIGSWAFHDCPILHKVEIPNSITRIEAYTFHDCKNLKEMVIPNSVKSIGDCAFRGCKNLKEIVIPNSLKSIEYGAFWECVNLKEIVIPDSIESIGECAFSDCKDLKEIVIPDSVKSIGDFAFDDCINLKEITIPYGVPSIGNFAFRECVNLKEIVIPDSVESIGNSAFSDCKNLKEIVIPDSVTSIDDWAFSKCESLREISIPNSVTSIGERAFDDCKNLKIKAHKGSYAEQYTLENDIPFEEI